MKRQSLSPLRRLKVWENHAGRCHICSLKISRKGWDVEHIIPLALGGADEERNMAPAHKHCHVTKTAADVASIAKAKRTKAKHIGIKKRSQWQSKWRKKMNGEVVLR